MKMGMRWRSGSTLGFYIADPSSNPRREYRVRFPWSPIPSNKLRAGVVTRPQQLDSVATQRCQ